MLDGRPFTNRVFWVHSSYVTMEVYGMGPMEWQRTSTSLVARDGLRIVSAQNVPKLLLTYTRIGI